MNYTEIEIEWMKEILRDKEEYIKKLEEDRDFFKEQATLWRNDYKNEYEENKELKEKIRFLEQCLDNKEKVNKSLREELEKFNKWVKAWTIIIGRQGEEIRKLKNSIEYRKKKADKNQEKANQIDKIMNLPWVMVDWKIDWSKVAVYYCI